MSANDIDLVQLSTFLGEYIPGFGGPLSASKTSFGQSNPTYFLSNEAGDEIVLRRKPFGELLPSAHAIDREYRVMQALAATPVPVPQMLVYCDDASIIGAEFFCMEKIVGRTALLPTLDDPGWDPASRGAVFEHMADVLAALHSVDVSAVGLGDYGKPGNYFERQLGRWTKQYRASETTRIEPMEELMAWLSANMMDDAAVPSLVHGDYRIDNLILDPADPKIVAVVDWELSTLGHPLADLGQVLMQWLLPPNAQGRGLMGIDRKALGLPSNGAFVRRYAAARRLSDVPDLTFPIAFSFFRMGGILQGVYKRGLEGNASDPKQAAAMGAFVPQLAKGALQVINQRQKST